MSNNAKLPVRRTLPKLLVLGVMLTAVMLTAVMLTAYRIILFQYTKRTQFITMELYTVLKGFSPDFMKEELSH